MAIDILARRTRFAFLNAQAALRALLRVVDTMSNEHVNATVGYFETMGWCLGVLSPGEEKGREEGSG